MQLKSFLYFTFGEPKLKVRHHLNHSMLQNSLILLFKSYFDNIFFFLNKVQNRAEKVLHWAGEKVNTYLSTATTTLWELVSPIDSWILAICFQSTFPPTATEESMCHFSEKAVQGKNALRVLSVQKHISTVRYLTNKRNDVTPMTVTKQGHTHSVSCTT